MKYVTFQRLCPFKVPVVDSLPEDCFFVVATGCYAVPSGYTVLVDDTGKLFAIKNS